MSGNRGEDDDRRRPGDGDPGDPQGGVARVAAGTPAGTQRYPDDKEAPAATREGGSGLADLDRAWMDEQERLWNGGRVPLDMRNAEREILGLDPIPESEVRAIVSRERRRGVHQVGVKLAQVDYESLAAAANRHGVAPTTMARLLLKRALTGLKLGEARRANQEPGEDD